MKRFLQFLLLSLAIIAFGAIAKDKTSAVDQFAEAKALFDQYASLEASYDSTVADLYADHAVIKNRRTYPDGQVRVLELPAVKYKELIRAAMPLAKASNDYSTYSDVTFAREGDSVRISAVRYSVRKKYSSPISLLVAKQDGGPWLIIEELSESQP